MKIDLPNSPLITEDMRKAVRILEALTELEVQVIDTNGKAHKGVPVIDGGKAIVRIDLR